MARGLHPQACEARPEQHEGRRFGTLEVSVKPLDKLKYHHDESNLQRQVPPDLTNRLRKKQVWLPLVESRPVEQENDKPYTDREPPRYMLLVHLRSVFSRAAAGIIYHFLLRNALDARLLVLSIDRVNDAVLKRRLPRSDAAPQQPDTPTHGKMPANSRMKSVPGAVRSESAAAC